MATVPKPTAMTQASTAPAVRSVSPSTRVASVTTKQVDAPNVSTNISFDAAASGFHQEQPKTALNSDDGSRQQYSDPGFDRLFTANTQVFAEIFQAESKGNEARVRDGLPARNTQTPVSSIIKTYENNALIISGRQHFNGTEFSFNL